MSRYWSMTRRIPSPCQRRRSCTTSSTEPKRRLWAPPLRLVLRDAREPFAGPGPAAPGPRPACEAHHDRGHQRELDRRRIPPDRAAVAGQDLELPRIFVEGHARHVPLVGELGGDAHCPALAPPSDDQPGAGGERKALRLVEGDVTAVPASPASRATARGSPAPRPRSDACAREAAGRDAEHPVLHLVPARSDAEVEAAAGQLVDGGGALGQERGVVERRGGETIGPKRIRFVAVASHGSDAHVSSEGRVESPKSPVRWSER